MRFKIAEEVFERFPGYIVGVVLARDARAPEGIDASAAEALLRSAVEELPGKLGGAPEALRSQVQIAVWRDAFSAAGINPNRFPSSVEALAARALKAGQVPAAGPIVDLANATSLRWLLPVGAHDIDRLRGDLEVRQARDAEIFTPFGSQEHEAVDPGELVYADDEEVRTRRWIWRQGEKARIYPGTRNVFYPVDGFEGTTSEAVHQAVQALAENAALLLGARVSTHFLDRDHPSIDLERSSSSTEGAGMDEDTRHVTTPEELHAELRERHELDDVISDAQRTQTESELATEATVRAGMQVEEADRWGGVNTGDAAIHEVMDRAVVDIIVRAELEQRLRSGRKLRIKLGIDPTGPHVHVGRTVPLLKLRQLQDLGHQIVLIIGDFTGRIGDPSDKDAQRVMLTREQVERNMENYKEQVGKILDLSRVEFRHNSQWLEPLNFADVVQLATRFTVAQMLQRENFANRWEQGKPIGLHELLYPLMQGFDSVAIEADVELGSTDQLFNMLAGRTLQEDFGRPPQSVLLTNMIPGTDGRKMSTSWGNAIYIDDEPRDQYGKLMSTNDELIPLYMESCTRMPMEEVEHYTNGVLDGSIHPMDAKKRLAWEIVKMYYGGEAADLAQADFERQFQQRGAPSEIPAVPLARARGDKASEQGELSVVDLLINTGVAPSRKQAQRLIEQGGVQIDGEKVAGRDQTARPVPGMLIKVGRSYVKIEE